MDVPLRALVWTGKIPLGVRASLPPWSAAMVVLQAPSGGGYGTRRQLYPLDVAYKDPRGQRDWKSEVVMVGNRSRW